MLLEVTTKIWECETGVNPSRWSCSTCLTWSCFWTNAFKRCAAACVKLKRKIKQKHMKMSHISLWWNSWMEATAGCGWQEGQPASCVNQWRRSPPLWNKSSQRHKHLTLVLCHTPWSPTHPSTYSFTARLTLSAYIFTYRRLPHCLWVRL